MFKYSKKQYKKQNQESVVDLNLYSPYLFLLRFGLETYRQEGAYTDSYVESRTNQ